MATTRLLRRAAPLALALALPLPLILPGCASLTDAPADTSYDGLKLTSTAPMDAVYTKPGVDLSQYHQVIVDECSVAFRKNWQRDQNSSKGNLSGRVTDKDVAAIKKRLGQLCHDVFVEELQGGTDSNSSNAKSTGYQVVDTPAAGVLELRPSIVDLNINAPDIMAPGRSVSFTTSSGSMRLYLEAYDSVSGEILGRVIDKRKVPDKGYLDWTNQVTNTADAKRILRYWGSMLRDMLDKARQSQ